MLVERKLFKKILVCGIVITIIGCKNEIDIDTCSCKFNMDILLNKDNKEYSEYIKFYDKAQMQKCLNVYKNENPNDIKLEFESVYQFYGKQCPSYEINIQKEH